MNLKEIGENEYVNVRRFVEMIEMGRGEGEGEGEERETFGRER